MNITSAIATITVIVLITRYKINKFTYIGLSLLVISLINLLINIFGWNYFLIESVVSIAMRYVSDLSYSLFLIYTI